MNKLELKQELEGKYKHNQARLRRIECVYIPVTSRPSVPEDKSRKLMPGHILSPNRIAAGRDRARRTTRAA